MIEDKIKDQTAINIPSAIETKTLPLLEIQLYIVKVANNFSDMMSTYKIQYQFKLLSVTN